MTTSFRIIVLTTMTLFSLLNVGYASNVISPQKPTMGIHRVGIPVTGRVALKPFNTIDTNGFFHVNIVTGKNHYQVEVTGDKAIVEQVIIKRKNHTLYLSMPPDLRFFDTGPVNIQVEIPQLSYLRHRGNGGVTSNIPTTNPLILSAEGSGDITLRGEICLKKLTHSGTSNITVEWVNSPKLTIRAEGQGRISLAGKLTRLDATLYNTVRLDAKYLRIKNAHINTTQNSVAEVAVVDSLNALASDNSNIYYFQNPHYLAPYMRDQGAILPMYSS